MSNPITLQATKFVNFPQGDETLGFRIYDNYGALYVNTLEAIPEDDMSLLQLVLAEYADGDINDMLSHIEELETGLTINGNYYEWEQIQPLFESA